MKHCLQQRFCVRRAEVQNSTVVFQLNFSNNISFVLRFLAESKAPKTLKVNFKKNEIFITYKLHVL
ncbi:hypothetical protein IO90_09775 [Chryseobacterium sp. FH1]|nr:hypothetical protein IO90_09775 [Chryseobacterium sp. FH1]